MEATTTCLGQVPAVLLFLWSVSQFKDGGHLMVIESLGLSDCYSFSDFLSEVVCSEGCWSLYCGPPLAGIHLAFPCRLCCVWERTFYNIVCRIKMQLEAWQGCGPSSPLKSGVAWPPCSIFFVMEWQSVAQALGLRQHSTSPEVCGIATKITW